MKSLEELIKKYIQNHAHYEDWKLSDFRNRSKPLEALIENAVWAKDPRLKRDYHQNRIPQKTLEDMTKKLLNPLIINELHKCQCFDDIFTILYELKEQNFGPLAIYDTSLRLGAIFDLYPSVIYLHQGAFEGALNLLGKDIIQYKANYFLNNENYPYITLELLPYELHQLEPYHIENFLCINRNQLKDLSLK
ncbi:hypothetical protein ABID56_002560 [Alkalibacillus flavidus]|uniref:FRG domain-containing protein n=1 Tax=Alkalibacillus flavidus TaxID=546021 RepID=A0ABV2KXW1_9BACI